MKCYSFSKSPIEFSLIASLFRKCFSRDLDENYWTWRFLNNSVTSKKYINYILEDDNLVAYYAVSPCEIVIDNKSYKIALSNMTMTHPDYSGRGYFKLLANNLFEELKKDGFIGVYGFANANSHYGFKKNLGWKDLSPLNMFSLDEKDFKKIPIGNDYSFTTNLFSKNDLFEIEKLNFTHKSIHLNRSKEWLNWRLLKNPTNKHYALKIYENSILIGSLIYKKYLKSIDIMEIFYKNETNKFEMLNIAYSYLLEKEALQLNCWINFYSKEYSMMKKIGFKEGEFNTNFGIIPFIENEKLLSIKNWHYRFIDSDVF